MFMDKVPLMVLIFYSIPESLLIFTFGYVILGYPIKPCPIILATLISVPASYLARLLPFPFGIHSLIGLLVISILFILICKFPIKHGLIAALLSLSILVALDNSIYYLIQAYFKVTLKDIWGMSPLIRTISAYPHLLIWALITFFIYKRKLSLGGTQDEFRNRE